MTKRGESRADSERRKKNEKLSDDERVVRVTEADSKRSKRKIEVQEDEKVGKVKEAAAVSCSELIPGIPDDITVHTICTKLSYPELHRLWLANCCAWPEKEGLSRYLFEARQRSHSTDKFLVINCKVAPHKYGIALYSLRDKASFFLPPVPGVAKGIPKSCECVTWNGTIYILGGFQKKHGASDSSVYMMDLAGFRKTWEWKKCASMLRPRCNFGCGIVDEKFYICGGSSSGAPVCETEVYDPKLDSWSELKPIPNGRTNHEVAVWEDELWVYKGEYLCPNHRARMNMEIYNPRTNEWITLKLDHPLALARAFGKHGGTIFMAKGRLHSLLEGVIYVHDIETSIWTLLQSVSREVLIGRHRRWIGRPTAVLVVDNSELVIIDHVFSARGPRVPSQAVLHGRGLGIREDELKWEQKHWAPSFGSLKSPFVRVLEL